MKACVIIAIVVIVVIIMAIYLYQVWQDAHTDKMDDTLNGRATQGAEDFRLQLTARATMYAPEEP